jgi:predicted nucleic acid-binding protein
LTLLARRTDYHFAAERGRELLNSPRLAVLRSTEHEDAAAVEVFEKFADQRVSFTDCISFVLMKAHRIKRAFTFDRHFHLAGFRIWPGPRLKLNGQ